jgi:hypothetical protein
MVEDPRIDRWHPQYFKTLGAPDEVKSAFQTILGYLGEVETMCNYKCDGPLQKIFSALESLPRAQRNLTSKWSNQRYAEKRSAAAKAKVERIKGFEIGQLVKFRPRAAHHSEQDGLYHWNVDHIIGRVSRRNKHTVSVIEVSRRKNGIDVEVVSSEGIRWRMHPEKDDIVDE